MPLWNKVEHWISSLWTELTTVNLASHSGSFPSVNPFEPSPVDIYRSGFRYRLQACSVQQNCAESRRRSNQLGTGVVFETGIGVL